MNAYSRIQPRIEIGAAAEDLHGDLMFFERLAGMVGEAIGKIAEEAAE
jgi:hypothetical protein